MTDRRQQIIAAARALLDEDPRSSMSVRKVAERAGVGPTTLRHYFPTQRVLREAVLAAALESDITDLRIADVSVPARERLLECVEQMLPPPQSEASPVEGWLDVVLATFGASSTGEARLAWQTHVLHSRRTIARWIDALVAEGAAPPGETERRARLLLTVVDGLAVARMLPVLPLDRVEERTTLLDAVDAVIADWTD